MRKLSETIREFFEYSHTLNRCNGLGGITKQAELSLDAFKKFAAYWIEGANVEGDHMVKRWPVCTVLEEWLITNDYYVKLKEPIMYSEYDAVGPAPQNIHDVMNRLFFALYPGRSTLYPFAPVVYSDEEDRTYDLCSMREFYCATNDSKVNHRVPMRIEFINAILEA